MWGKKEPLYTVDGNVKLVQPLWKFLKKLKLEIPYDLVILLLGIYPRKMKTLNRKLYAGLPGSLRP